MKQVRKKQRSAMKGYVVTNKSKIFSCAVFANGVDDIKFDSKSLTGKDNHFQICMDPCLSQQIGAKISAFNAFQETIRYSFSKTRYSSFKKFQLFKFSRRSTHERPKTQ